MNEHEIAKGIAPSISGIILANARIQASILDRMILNDLWTRDQVHDLLEDFEKHATIEAQRLTYMAVKHYLGLGDLPDDLTPMPS